MIIPDKILPMQKGDPHAGTIQHDLRGRRGEIIEKNHVSSPPVRLVKTERSLSFMKIRKKYWNATHNCYAYIMSSLAHTL